MTCLEFHSCKGWSWDLNPGTSGYMAQTTNLCRHCAALITLSISKLDFHLVVPGKSSVGCLYLGLRFVSSIPVPYKTYNYCLFPVAGRLRQGHYKFESHLANLVRPCFKIKSRRTGHVVQGEGPGSIPSAKNVCL